MFAFLVSLAGLYTSRHALEQTRQQYLDERSMVLMAKIGERTDQLTLAAADSGFRLLNATMRFPSVIHKDQLDVQEDGSVWGMGSFDFELKRYVSERFPPLQDQIQVLELGIPTIINSSYTTKGKRYFEKSNHF
jgi:hypothetical protein